MNARRLRAVAGALLALTAVVTAVQPAAAQEPPLPYDRYPVLVTSGLVGFDLYMEPLAVRLEQTELTDAYIWSPPELGLGDLGAAGASFKAKIEELQAKYGGRQIDVIAYGVGGLAARYYIENLGGGSSIDSLIMLATPNQGTRVADLAQQFSFGMCGTFLPVCNQVTTKSAFLKDLNDPAKSLGGTWYTNIVSTQDELVVPHSNAYMTQAPQMEGQINNLTIQDQCPNHVVENLTYPFDGVVYSAITDALWHRQVLFACGSI